MLTIRPATAADQDAVVAMCQRFFSASLYGTFIAPDDLHLRVNFDTCLTYGTVLVAELDAALVGFIALVALPHPYSGEMYAAEQAWWVEPAARHARAGPLLHDSAEEWCRSNSIHMIQMVAPSGSRVGRFYQMLGYTALETAFFKRL